MYFYFCVFGHHGPHGPYGTLGPFGPYGPYGALGPIGQGGGPVWYVLRVPSGFWAGWGTSLVCA